MDAGLANYAYNMATRFRYPHVPRKNSRPDLDRFIPNRNAMDFDNAHYMLMEARRGKANHQAVRSEYAMQLADVFNLNRTRILAFKNNPPIPDQVYCVGRAITKRGRYIPRKPEWSFDAPDFVDDYYLNLLDWGSGNVLAIALGNTVHLWNASNGDVSQLVTVDEEIGPVTSVKWASDGRHIAVGLNNSVVQIWDLRAYKHLNTLRGCHSSRVGALEWNDQILTTGGMDGQIVNSDVRMRDHIVQAYRGHNAEVCGLRWSASGKHLASGGNDDLVHVWDRSMASSNSPTQWLHRLQDHTAAVKALAWCPFNENLLASG